jgi:hypothetical protein
MSERPSIFIREKPFFSSERMLQRNLPQRFSVKNLVVGLKGLEKPN